MWNEGVFLISLLHVCGSFPLFCLAWKAFLRGKKKL